MRVAPCLLPTGTVVRTQHSRSERVLRERKDTCDGWWVDLPNGEDSGGLADHVLDSDYVVVELPASALRSEDPVMARGALAFIDLLLAEDVFAGDRDERPESPRDLAAAWRDAGYRQATLDVYETIVEIVASRGLSEAAAPDDRGAS